MFPDEYDVARVVSRENGNKLKWPYQYSKRIRKVVIHHTAETGVEKGRAPDEVMRAIYRYHAVSRGWGDIGYHYIIAPDGTVYQGRAGGDFVVGGHVYCNNIGTIGIALMGNFNEQEVSDKQLEALGRILPRLSKKYQLDLTGEEWYHGEFTPNLLGHRDLGATACPGENMHGLLPKMRQALSGTAEIQFAKEQIADGTPADDLKVLQMDAGDEKDLILSFENTGKTSWYSSTWLFATAGDGVTVKSVSSGKRYVAARMREKEVKPGETATFRVVLEAGYKGGMSTISFVPVVQDKRVTNAETLQVIEVEKADWGSDIREIRTKPDIPVTNKATSFSLDLKNTGGSRWSTDDIRIVAQIPDERKKFNLTLKSTTSSGNTGTFTGRMPALNRPGEKLLLFDFYHNGERLPMRMFQPLLIKQSNNRAETRQLNEKLVMAQANTSYAETVVFKNTGNTEWYRDDLELVAQLRREKTVYKPREESIAPGSDATFDVKLPIERGINPYVISLKDGRQRLFAKVLIARGMNRLTNSVAIPNRAPLNTRAAPQQTVSDTIRIKLGFANDQNIVKLSANGKFNLYDDQGRLLMPARSGQTLEIKQFGPILKFRDNPIKYVRAVPVSDETLLEVTNWLRHPAWDANKNWNDNRFPGVLEVRVVDGELTVINDLPLEQYMLGIGETLESDHIEKKKAIALVARSYAAYYMDPKNRKFPGKPYDGSDNPNEFQKYLGASLTERAPEWRKAVSATEDEIISFNDEVIKTPFHTSSGGRVKSGEEKWGWTNTPYLISIDDPGCRGKSPAGHGVGMSGCGSQYFAEQGKRYRDILQYYYPGTRVEYLNE